MTVINRFKRNCVMPLKEGEEKTHYCQQHWVSLSKFFIKIILFIYLFKTTMTMGQMVA